MKKLRTILNFSSVAVLLIGGAAWALDYQLPAAREEPSIASPTASANNDIDKFLDTWFATPDSPGSVAIGMAEGTRTADGAKTQNWYGHFDPAWLNHRVGNPRNQGTYSCQTCSSSTPEDADEELLHARLRPKLKEILEQYPDLDELEWLAIADALVQAPKTTYGLTATLPQLLKQYRGTKATREEDIAAARTESFVSPSTGRLQAGGFGNNRERLYADQLRRTRELNKKLDMVKTAESMYGADQGIVCNLATGQCFRRVINGSSS